MQPENGLGSNGPVGLQAARPLGPPAPRKDPRSSFAMAAALGAILTVGMIAFKDQKRPYSAAAPSPPEAGAFEDIPLTDPGVLVAWDGLPPAESSRGEHLSPSPSQTPSLSGPPRLSGPIAPPDFLMPWPEEGLAPPRPKEVHAGARQKPRLRRTRDLYPIARRNAGGAFRRMSLITQPSHRTAAYLPAVQAPRSKPALLAAAGLASPVGSRTRGVLTGKAPLPKCENCTDALPPARGARFPAPGPGSDGSHILRGKFLGTCDDQYAYQITNVSNQPLSMTLGNQRGDAWRVSDLPPGGSAMIRSPAMIDNLSANIHGGRPR